MGQADKRITVGVLVGGITDEFTESVCKGVMRAAKKEDVNVVVFPCKYLDRDLTGRKEIMYEYQYNTLLSYARKDNVDALLISADSIGCYTSKEKIRSRLEQYSGIPCVLLASKQEGYVSVTYENYEGIREGMEYLIQHKNCRKFGMIGGPEDNSDAFERKQAFLSALEENGIPFQDCNYAEGTLSRRSEEAYRELLDENPELQAVFCVNDDTAIGFYSELNRRGLVPGKDMYVFGYDNTVQAAKAKPSLSSVWADSAKLGEKALEMVLHMLEGELVSSVALPAKFIKRESFGSGEEEHTKSVILRIDEEFIEEAFDNIFYRCKYENLGEQIEVIHDMFQGVMRKMAVLLEQEEKDEWLYDRILGELEEFLSHRVLEYADVERFMIYMEQIYQTAKEKKADTMEQLEIQEIFTSMFRRIVIAMDYRFGTMKETEERANFSMKLFVRDIMQFEKGSDQSYAVLLENLEWLDIRNACVYLFEKPMVHLHGEEFALPEKLDLKAVLKEGKVQSISSLHQRKRVSELYDNEDIAHGKCPMVLLPLFSNEIMYGVALCDLTEKLFENGEFLTNQMSSAVKMIELLSANEKIQQQLEESLVTLKENNIVLDNLSKSDGLTGILNRRGFYAAAGEFLEKNKKEHEKTMFAYIDMNNLKIINDRYGHEEGDFSLKLIGEILVDVIGGDGIAGRIGGDEFACVMNYKAKDEGKGFSEEIEERFCNFNSQSDKNYNVTVSVGVYVSEETVDMGLKEALALADARLYEVKRHRVKNVAKSSLP